MERSGIDNCACKRGFFTLRDCERPATATCERCSRRVCDAHLAPQAGATVCVECVARQEEEKQAIAADPRRPASYRARYYRTYGYQPMWWGSYDPFWNDYGYRTYDYDDDDDRGGFGDS